MTPETVHEVLAVLADAKAQLTTLSLSTEREISSMTHSFKILARQAQENLALAAGVVTCVESGSMASVLARVQSLCATVKNLLESRLTTVARILETLKAVGKMLSQLAWVTRRQEAIAVQFKALSVLTKVEVVQLGSVGADFQQLARELADFAAKVSKETQDLAKLTEDQSRAIEETKQVFAVDLPGLRKEMIRIESDVGSALQAISTRLAQLAMVPGQFRTCVQQTAHQIDGVVAAVQAHDITRQQIEHVQEALDLIASKFSAHLRHEHSPGNELAQTYAGLTIQIGQLKNIKETVGHWTSQIRSCIEGIQRLSASEISGIGPIVLEQERDLSSELSGIEELQQASQTHSGRVRQMLGGLSSLLELVNGHLRRSERIRDGLQILTWNSIIEARRMGVRGVVVSAIANLITGSSDEWNAATDQSRLAVTEILDLVRQTDTLMESFSEASSQKLREDQRQTQATLTEVRTTAAFVAREASQMHIATQEMQATAAKIHSTENLLLAGFATLNIVLTKIESITRRLASDAPQVIEDRDTAEVEELFSASYTTEIERHVLHAALHGSALPLPQQTFAGNSVELF